MVPDTVYPLTNRQNCVMLLDVNCIESFSLIQSDGDTKDL